MTTPPESPGAVLTLDWTDMPSARNVATPAPRGQQIPLDRCGAHGPAAATVKARALVRQIRSDLAAVEDEIRNAPFIGAVEAGTVPVEQIAAVAAEEYSIIRSDMTSFSRMAQRWERQMEAFLRRPRRR